MSPELVVPVVGSVGVAVGDVGVGVPVVGPGGVGVGEGGEGVDGAGDVARAGASGPAAPGVCCAAVAVVTPAGNASAAARTDA
ncbi:hypothetical protein [Streptomyces sp. bgisy034]|uniref:hypothetical protein n=1 Tax=Streptomyces sp. bgisy034 TaxID=3413774 RepID=UPI003EBD6971